MILTILATLALSSLFVASGLIAYRKSHLFEKVSKNTFMEIGASFFIGLSMFLSFWIILSHIVGSAKVSLIISLFIPTVTTYFYKAEILGAQVRTACAAWTVGVMLFFVSIGITQSLVPMPLFFVDRQDQVDPFYGFGGISHSFRAGNISEYILQSDRIPVVNQNIGQSTLVSALSILGLNRPQLSLVLWFNVSIAFLCLLVYGFVRPRTQRRLWAIGATLIVILGNNSLYLHYVSLTDGVDTILFASNTDSILGIATFFLFTIACWNTLKSQARGTSYFAIIIIASFIILWSICAGQNIVLAVLIFSYLFFVFKLKKVPLVNMRSLFIIFLVFVPIGIMQGGLLLPTRLSENLEIPGLMRVTRSDFPFLQIKFPEIYQGHRRTLDDIGLMHKAIVGYEKNGQFLSTSGSGENTTTNQGATTLHNKLKKYEIILELAKAERSLRTIFFPLLGLVLAIVIIKYKLLNEETRSFTYFFTGVGIITFSTGILISSSFLFYGYSGELTRFLYFGIFATKLLLAVSLLVILKKKVTWRKGLGVLFVYTLVLYMFAGPVLEYTIVQTLGRFVLPLKLEGMPTIGLSQEALRPLSPLERLNLLVNMHGMVGNNTIKKEPAIIK